MVSLLSGAGLRGSVSERSELRRKGTHLPGTGGLAVSETGPCGSWANVRATKEAGSALASVRHNSRNRKVPQALRLRDLPDRQLCGSVRRCAAWGSRPSSNKKGKRSVCGHSEDRMEDLWRLASPDACGRPLSLARLEA